MSKQSDKIIEAYHKGENDKRGGKPHLNPYHKNSEREKYRAYNNGYNSTVIVRRNE